jgi:hypothetical protein
MTQIGKEREEKNIQNSYKIRKENEGKNSDHTKLLAGSEYQSYLKSKLFF